MKKIGRIISILLIATGFIGFLSGSYFYGENNEIPLGDIKGFVVDKNDNIYIGCGFYERIQVYNENGEFLKNWPIEAYGGTFYMGKTDKDEILITKARGDEQILFDINGRVLSKKDIDDKDHTHAETDWRTFTSDKGVKYEIKGSLFQKIVKLNPEQTIIKQSILLQLIKGPFNVWLLAVIGGVIAYLSKDKKALIKISKKNTLTLLIGLIGMLTYGQNKNNSDIIATWKLIENKTESNESKIDVGELIIIDEDGNIDRYATEDKKNYQVYIQIENDILTQYFSGDAYQYKYTLKDNTIMLGQYILNIVKLTEKLLILRGEKELRFEKSEIDLDSYKLYKNKEPVYGLYNPLILFSYPNG